MNKIRGLVVGVLLAVWCFPAMSSANALPPETAPPPALAATGSIATGTTPASSTDPESASLAKREQQTPNLQDFKGGGVTIYIGSGVLLIAVIILIILLI